MNTECCDTKEKNLPSESKRFHWDNLAWLLLIIPVAAILIRIFLGSFVFVSGRSMEPTFQDMSLIFGTFVKDDTEISVGDIIVFKHDGKNLVKRVAAIPGDKVPENDKMPTGKTLKDGEYWVLGDNTEHSTDSRTFGEISRDTIEYKYRGIYIRDPFLWGAIIIGVIAVLVFVRKELNFFPKNIQT